MEGVIDTKASGIECERVERCTGGEEYKVQPVGPIGLPGDNGIHPGTIDPDQGSGLRIDSDVGSGFILGERMSINAHKNDPFGLVSRTSHDGIDSAPLIIDGESGGVIVF